MEGQVWMMVRRFLCIAQRVSGRFSYSNEDILAVVVWATLHDRPMVWGCQPENWPKGWRPARLPHPSTISRRWRRADVQEDARRIHEATASIFASSSRYAAIDGRPLLVGGYSKDPDARAGRACGGMGRGYKLHALVSPHQAIVTYEVQSLPVGEPKVAVPLLSRAPQSITRVVGDANYDSQNLHRVAGEAGRKLYTPIRQNRVGRRQQKRRLKLLRLSRRTVGRRLMIWRNSIERAFGNHSAIGFGYKGLPSWARRLHRVRRWMWAKTLLYNVWLIHKKCAA